MNIVFLTTDDPIYLPAFFERVLSEYSNQTQAVYSVLPLYKNQTAYQAVWRYYRTFGVEGLIGLIPRVIEAKLRKQSIATTCKRWNVKCSSAEDVNAWDFLYGLRKSGTDLIISVSCPQIFKRPLIELPDLGCLNIHGAILPHYRGVLPSFWMLANNEEQAGVSIYYINEKIDAGELCGQRVFNILLKETLNEFIRRSKYIAADLLIEVLIKIENGTIIRKPMDLSQGSYYSWPNKEAVRRFRANGRRLW